MISICIDCNAAVCGLRLNWVRNAEDQENEGGEVRHWSKKLVMEGWGAKICWQRDHVCWAPLPAQQ